MCEREKYRVPIDRNAHAPILYGRERRVIGTLILISLASVRTCLSLLRDVGDSFENRKHKAMRPPVVYAPSVNPCCQCSPSSW